MSASPNAIVGNVDPNLAPTAAELEAAQTLLSFNPQNASTPLSDQENFLPATSDVDEPLVEEESSAPMRSVAAERWREPLAGRRRTFRGGTPASRQRMNILREALRLVRPEELHRSRELTSDEEMAFSVELELLDNALLGHPSIVHPGCYTPDASSYDALLDALEERRDQINEALARLGKSPIGLPAWGADFKIELAWPRPVFSRLSVLFREDVEVYLAYCAVPESVPDGEGPFRVSRRGRARQRRNAMQAIEVFMAQWRGEPSAAQMATTTPDVTDAGPNLLPNMATANDPSPGPSGSRNSPRAPHNSPAVDLVPVTPSYVRGVNSVPLGVRNSPPHLLEDAGIAPVEDRSGMRNLRRELAEARTPLMPRPDDPGSPFVRLGRSRRLVDAFRHPRESVPALQDEVRRLSLNDRLDEAEGANENNQDGRDEEEVETYLARPSSYWGNGGIRTAQRGGRGGFGMRPSLRVPRDRENVEPNASGSGAGGSRIVEPHFDTKLKVDQIDEWDGNTENLLDWIESVNVLAARSDTIFRQLGELVPTRLRKGARDWWTSLPLSTRQQAMTSWATLRNAIARYYMGKRWFDRQKLLAKQCKYRDTNAPNESPSEYFIRKFKLLETAEDYTESVLIMAIMDGAPPHWHSIIDTSTLHTTSDLQDKILYHEDALRSGPGGMEDVSRQILRRLRSLEEEMKNKPTWRRSPAHQTAVRLASVEEESDEEMPASVKLAGWSKELGPPKYPRDDTTRSKGKSPEDKGARPCRHCGSPKHWDPDCKYARKEIRRVRAHLATASDEFVNAQNEYEELYASDDSEDSAVSLN